jgi:L-fuconolactonase
MAETDWLLDLAESSRSIAAVVGWVDLALEPELILARITPRLQRRAVFTGVRHITSDEAYGWLVSRNILRGLATIGAAGMSFDLLITPRDLSLIPRISDSVPDLWMVIDHMANPRITGRPNDVWVRGIREAAKNPRVYCKLSGVLTALDHHPSDPADLRAHVEVMIDAFGFERLMIGSDWPVCTLIGSYVDAIGAIAGTLDAMPSLDTQGIFGSNARRFYRIPPGPQAKDLRLQGDHAFKQGQG